MNLFILLTNTIAQVNGPAIDSSLTGDSSPFEIMSKISSTPGASSGLTSEFSVFMTTIFKSINAASISIAVVSAFIALIEYGLVKKTQTVAEKKQLVFKNCIVVFGVSCIIWILNTLISVICKSFGLKLG